MKRLGILITKMNDLDAVWRLVGAAHAKQVEVYVHLTGEGVKAVRNPVFQCLRNAATVTICRKSSIQKGLPAFLIEQLSDLMTSPDQIAEVVNLCDRCLIF